MNFNEKLIELRKSKGLSQDELGQRLGVSRQTISKWELAQSYPDFQRLVLFVNSGRTATLARRFSHGVTGF